MSLKIKTKLRYGIGLLFAMIVLLGGLSVKNISDMSADTRNILADNYNSLLYSRRMLDALERIDSDPSAQADFEKNLGLQKKNITEVDENVATSHLVAQYERLAKERNEENIRRVRLALNQVMSLNMASIYRKSQVAESTSAIYLDGGIRAAKGFILDLGDWPLLYGGRFRFFNTFPPFDKYPYPYVDGRYHGDR